MTEETIFAFDTETELMRQGYMAPLVSCVSYAMGKAEGLVHWSEAGPWLRALFQLALERRIKLVGHNTPYDLACISYTWPELSDLIWDLFDHELIGDTIVRQKLSDLAEGKYRGFRVPGGAFVPIKYDLDSVTNRHLGYRLEKDEWRLQYGKLRPFPLNQWPEGAQIYPVKDARATHDVHQSQTLKASQRRNGPWFFVDEHAQTRAAWWLHLTSNHGIMTSADAVERLRAATQEELDHLEGILTETHVADDGTVFPPLVEITHTKHKAGTGGHAEAWVERKATLKKKAAQFRVRHSCAEQGREPRLSKTGKEVEAALAKGKISYSEKGKARGTDLDEYVSIDRDACLETGDPLLLAYTDYSSARKTLKTDCEAYARGSILPLHTRFESLAATGRTTSSGQSLKGEDGNAIQIGANIQNVRWNFPERCTNLSCRSRKVKDHTCQVCGSRAEYPPGIRECFIPRPGYVFASADYDQGELRTLAQVCLRWVGYSKLAEVLNSGGDPHMIVAAQILGKSYEWCLENKKHPDVQNARQTAKVANFGFPGGLGYEKLVLFARMAYHVILTVEQAKALKVAWFAAYPEMREYFRCVERMGTPGGTFTVEHLFSRRLRAEVFYCVACNSPFQGLLADAAKNAGYLIARGCYRDRESPLFGCRIVNFIHDEFIVEVPDDGPLFARATAAAQELARLMRVGGEPYLPDVPLTTEPLLMRRWSKKAKAIWIDDHLEPWDIAA